MIMRRRLAACLLACAAWCADGADSASPDWIADLLARRQGLGATVDQAALKQTWTAFAQAHPHQALWLERDTAALGGPLAWLQARSDAALEKAMLANQLRILRGAEYEVADPTGLDGATAGDRRWLAAYAPLAERSYGRRLGLPLVGEYKPPAYVEPVTPPTRALDADAARQTLERDWLFQAGGKPTAERIASEIAWAKALARRLAALPGCPDQTPLLARLDACAARLDSVKADEAATKALYLEVRAAKRDLHLAHPLIDFRQLVVVDNPYPGRIPGAIWDHESNHRHGYNVVPGGRLLLVDGLHPGAPVQRLAPPHPGSFLRPDVSFDGTRVVFSFKPHDDDAFHLYEVGVDGKGLRQITHGKYDDLDPVYLPDGRFLFSSTRGHTYVRCLPCSPCFVISRCDADGRNLYILSQGNEPEYTPAILHDGRVVYTRWEYTDKALWRVQKLWTMHTDGTGVHSLWGNQSVWPDLVAEARPIPGSNRLMFSGVGHHAWHTGCIGIIDPAKGTNYPHGLTKVTADMAWPESGDGPQEMPESKDYHGSGKYDSYKAPYPLGERDFLVCARSGKRFRAYLMDVDGNRELLYEGAHHIMHVLPVRKRTPPNVLPERARWPAAGAAAEPGVLYSSNVFAGVPDALRAVATSVRVVQQDHKTYSTWFKAWQHQGPVVSLVQAEGVKRILGTTPIEADGSISFRLPPGRAVYLQLLDDRQRALHTMRSFTGVMPGEQRGCTGCHELGTRSPVSPARATAASVRGPLDLTPPPWGAGTSISYERFCQPVLDRHCTTCHSSGEAQKALDLTVRPSKVAWNRFGQAPQFGRDGETSPFSEPYATLVGGAFGWSTVQKKAFNAHGLPVNLAGGLIVEGYGQRDPASLVTLPPMSHLSYASRLVALATSGTHYKAKVDGEDLLRLMAWIDLNCPYLGDEEIRRIPDPSFPWMDSLPMRPLVRSAPDVDRSRPQEGFASGEDRLTGR